MQTSPRLVMASHHSSLALQKMKGPRNAFIPIAACVVTCLELSPARSPCREVPRVRSLRVGLPGGTAPAGHPLWDRCRSHSPGHSPVAARLGVWLQPCVMFSGGPCKVHTHLLLPSPSSSSFRGLWGWARARFQLSPTIIIPSSTVPSSGEPEAGS